ncbi:hypothetical protein C0995_015956 [Termitomyces sp. Mi166|nr:hypothetical protein C0995_015956 [Termitomyces sp. Mi166\
MTSSKKKSTVTCVYPPKSGVEVKIKQNDSPLLVPKAQSSPIKISDSNEELPPVPCINDLNSFVDMEAECNDAKLSCLNEVNDYTLSDFIVNDIVVKFASDSDNNHSEASNIVHKSKAASQSFSSYKVPIVDNNCIDDHEKDGHTDTTDDISMTHVMIAKIQEPFMVPIYKGLPELLYVLTISDNYSTPKKTTSKALKNKSLFTPVEQPKPPVLHVVEAHRSIVEYNKLVHIYDGQSETGEPFHFCPEDFDHFPSWHSYKGNKSEIPKSSVVSVGYTANWYKSKGFQIIEPGDIASLSIPAKIFNGKGKAKVAKSII